ncbi:MAG TPA: TolC family protein [Gemmatimonadaceae bacterium]|jgi:outer membrane protein|nr:TolC family protein [Gemmatimonadaceae bacterium]
MSMRSVFDGMMGRALPLLAILVVPGMVARAQGAPPSADSVPQPAPLPTDAAPLSAQNGTQPLTLGDAIRIAAHRSAGAQNAQLRATEANAELLQQRSALFPTLNATGTQGARTLNSASFGITFPSVPGQPPLFDPNGQVIGPVKNIDYRGSFEQQIFNLGALERFRSYRTLAHSASTDATTAEQQAGSAAALAYIQALRANDDFRARSEDSVLAADLFNIAQNQLQAGVGIALDVTRAQAQLAGIRAQLIASRNTRDRTLLSLLRALNLPLSTTVALRDSLGSEDLRGLATDEATAVQHALTDRPDLRAAEERIMAARQAVSATRAERLPSLGFVGDDGVNGIKYNRLLNTYTYGLQITVPIFDGFRREGRIQQEQAQLHEAEVQERDLRDQATVDVRTALLDLNSAKEQVAATREQLQLTEQQISQARDRFRAGVAGNADVITAQLSLTSARTAVIDALTNYQNARVALARAQGAITTLP